MARGAIERSLTRRGPCSHERARRVVDAESPRNGTREKRRLIEASLGEASRMQRHRNDDVDARRKRLGGACHGRPEPRSEIEAPRVLQAHDRRRDFPS